jgi:hypothetical protein
MKCILNIFYFDLEISRKIIIQFVPIKIYYKVRLILIG